MKHSTGKKIDKYFVVPEDMLYKGSKMRFPKQIQKVFWAVLANTVGTEKERIDGESIRFTRRFLAPGYIKEVTGVPVATVRRGYAELEARNVIKKSKEMRESIKQVDGKVYTSKRRTTVIEVNTNVDRWIENPRKRAGRNKIND